MVKMDRLNYINSCQIISQCFLYNGSQYQHCPPQIDFPKGFDIVEKT